MGVRKDLLQTATNGSNTSHDSLWGRLRRKSQLQPQPRSQPESRSQSSPRSYPEEWQCIAHLKLLTAFARTREHVGEQMLSPSTMSSLHANDSQSSTDAINTTIRDRAWDIYIDQAYLRFEIWWNCLAPKDASGKPVRVDKSIYKTPGKLERLLHDTPPMVWTEKTIPPLDVIMILHAFMLNPRCFFEDCIRYDMLPLWRAGMPWHVLDEILDPSNNEYRAPPVARKAWTRMTGCAWDVRESHLRGTYPCPICGRDMVIESPDRGLKDGNLIEGESVVRVRCGACDTTFEETELHAHKIRGSIEDLLNHNIPLPGTLLDVDGLARSKPDPNSTPSTADISHPFDLNTLLLNNPTTTTEILTLTSPSTFSSSSQRPSVQSLKPHFLSLLPPPTNRNALHHGLSNFLLHTSDSLTRYSLCLRSATKRQIPFTRTMYQIGWLHSPALMSTTTTLLTRYRTFMTIIAQNPTQVAVPTHAVDLAWHTHQLSPLSYYKFCREKTGGKVFVDHDDRIGETTRDGAFEWTAREYQRLTGEEYSGCLCWYCATAREVNESQGKETLKLVEEEGGGHVDVKPGSELDVAVCTRIAAAQYAKLEEDFRVEGGRRDHKEFLKGYQWLYPRAVPVVK